MALSPQLLNFKSSGVYRLEFDKSQTANINVETLRLVVGHSRKGPYNTPVLIDSQETFNNVFGSIDKGLEKKGMFFHRSCIEALSRGPILALNLAKFTSGTDIAYWQAPSTNGSQQGIDLSTNDSGDYDNFFDNDKFMTPSDAATLAEINGTDNNLLNFVNIKQDSITVIVRQAASVKEFDLTAREWYGEGNVPEYLNEFDKMSDFMIDVFVFKGEFDAATMVNDPIYSKYFTVDGLDKTLLNEFANLRQVSLIAQYTGSILPGFKDLEGRNLYIESIINTEARRTGLFCAVDEDQVINENGTKIDFVGHIVNEDQDYELLSHVVKQSAVLSNHPIDIVPANVVTVNGDTLSVTNITQVEANKVVVGEDSLLAATTGEYAVVETANWVQTAAAIPSTQTLYNQTASTVYGLMNGDSKVLSSGNTVLTIVNSNPAVFNDYTDAQLVNPPLTGSFLLAGTGVANTAFTVAFVPGVGTQLTAVNGTFDVSNAGPNNLDLFANNGVTASTSYIPAKGTLTIGCDVNIKASVYTALSGTNNDLNFWHVSNTRAIPQSFNGLLGTAGTYAANGTAFTVDYGTALNTPATFPISIGDYVQSATTNRIARVNRVSKSGNIYTVFCDIAVKTAWSGYYIKSFENASTHYKTFVLPKAEISVKNLSDYLSVLSGGNGLYDALVDKDMIDFRYVVDTFTSFDVNGLNNKSNLSQLAKDRQNASAILNAPTIEDFKKSFDPSFTDANGAFDTAYIATGGNQDKNPTKVYALPSIAQGANYAFFYGPGLIVSDNGKDIIVPAAAYVSNNFMDKYTSALPWSIVAGPRRGVVAGTNVKGTEYAFDKNDRDILEPFGINPIVFQRGTGLTILGNKTAQQSIKSALSSAHVREALIYIQDGMANILKDYVFEFNNVQTRLEIKTLADSFLEGVKQDGGVYEFKNVMDQSNNTNEVIDNNMGIIDTYVEPVKGLEIVVHRTTILNTGEIQSGNL